MLPFILEFILTRLLEYKIVCKTIFLSRSFGLVVLCWCYLSHWHFHSQKSDFTRRIIDLLVGLDRLILAFLLIWAWRLRKQLERHPINKILFGSDQYHTLRNDQLPCYSNYCWCSNLRVRLQSSEGYLLIFNLIMKV